MGIVRRCEVAAPTDGYDVGGSGIDFWRHYADEQLSWPTTTCRRATPAVRPGWCARSPSSSACTPSWTETAAHTTPGAGPSTWGATPRTSTCWW